MNTLIRKTLAGLCIAAALAGCNREEARRGDPQTLARLDARVGTFLKPADGSPGAVGVVALVDDRRHGVRWSTGRGVSGATGVAADQAFRAFSITKTFVAAATLKLVEQKRIGLDAPIGPLLSAPTLDALVAGGVDPAQVTVRQLLAHRSGLFDYAATPEFFAAVQENPQRRWTRLEQVRLALALNPPAAPDSVYAYSDTNYILLGEILERTTRKGLGEALRTTLDYKRLGLERTWMDSLEPVPRGSKPRLRQEIAGVDTSGFDPSFDLWGGGGLVTDAADLARFFIALFRGQVILPETLQLMSESVSGGGFGDTAYALGLMPFYVGNAQCFGHEGATLNVAAYCPSLDTAIVVAQVNNDNPGLSLDRPVLLPQLLGDLGFDTQSRPYGADFRRTRCTPEFAAAAVPVTCGMLAVPETRGNAASRTLELPVVLARDARKAATLEPLLVLGGGPGDPLFASSPGLLADAELAAPLVDGQDVVFVEQRGVGLSRPSLVCPTPPVDAAAAAICVTELQATGADLGAYNSLASASDFELLRTTLGYRKWNLLGFSYGTRLALTMARERPDTVASLTLDGVFPTEANPEDDAPAFSRTLDSVFTQCAADAGCAVAFPDLKARFSAAVAGYNSQPEEVNGQPLRGPEVVNALTSFQVQRELVGYLPALMDGFIRRDPQLLAALVPAEVPPAPPVSPADLFSDAMFYSVTCNEEIGFSDQAVVQALANGSDPVIAGVAAASVKNAGICAVWPSGLAPVRERDAVNLTVPVLVFNGEFDLQTPPEAGRQAATRWPTAQVVEFRGNGHVATQQSTACAVTLIAAFQRKGSAATVDDNCARELSGPTWQLALDEAFYAVLAGG